MNELSQIPHAIKLQKFPKMISELVHSNQFLKVFSVASLAVTLLVLIALLTVAGQPPMVITLSATGEVIEKLDSASPEEHVKAAVKRYLDLRYRWTPQDVKQNLISAKAFVLPKNLKAFESSTGNVAKFATERAVTQRVYPDKIEVNLKQSSVSVIGDRVTSIQGLKAAGDLKLQLNFQSGGHTKENPWGIYIVKEVLIS